MQPQNVVTVDDTSKSLSLGLADVPSRLLGNAQLLGTRSLGEAHFRIIAKPHATYNFG